MRVEGSSRLARICCQRALRSRLWAAAVGVVAGVDAASADAWASTGLDVAGSGSGAGGGAATCVGTTAVVLSAALSAAPLAVSLAAGTAAGSASSPSSSTSSHSRGWALWRSCDSLPLRPCCQRNNRACPNLAARGGRASRLAGEKLVSSRCFGAACASTRSRSRPANPCSTAAGSRPRSSRLRQLCSSSSGSESARPSASCSSSCSGTAPSSSQTALGSTGGGSKLS